MLEETKPKRTQSHTNLTQIHRELGEINATLLYIQSDIKDIKHDLKKVSSLDNFRSYIKGVAAIGVIIFSAIVSLVVSYIK